MKAYPDSKVTAGYGVIDNFTGASPDDADGWYDSVNDAIEFIEKKINLSKEELSAIAATLRDVSKKLQ